MDFVTVAHQSLVSELKGALSNRQRHRINEITAQLIARKAMLGAQWKSLSEVMLHNGELSLARRAAERLVDDQKSAPAALFQHASVCARAGDLKSARSILGKLPSTFPSVASYAFMRGSIETNLGNMETARAHLLAAVEANPQSGQSWLGFAMTGRLAGSDDGAQRILDAGRQMQHAPIIEQAQYLYARGKILDELGEVDAAFSAWDLAGTLMRKETPYQAADDKHSAAAAVANLDRTRIETIGAKITVDTCQPIFVTGTPRSGTTLVEQILTSHSAVTGGTELAKFGLIADDIGGTSADALAAWVAKGNDANAAAADYLHLLRERFGPGRRTVDKTLDASRYLGLAAALLPGASMIWLRRDRLDNALSVMRTFFVHQRAWNFSQKSIARHFMLEDALLDRWQAVLGDRLLVIDYEKLVANPRRYILRILAHCGLGEEQQVFEPHRSERAVTTASVTQVREPINSNAVGAAERYRPHLQPFLDAYTSA